MMAPVACRFLAFQSDGRHGLGIMPGLALVPEGFITAKREGVIRMGVSRPMALNTWRFFTFRREDSGLQGCT
jgi:hypothetical protein